MSRYLRDQVKQYKELCAVAYQLAGVMNAPKRFLDAFSEAADGNVLESPIDKLLPITKEEIDCAHTFERARAIVETWPGWKRNFTLTPYSATPADAASEACTGGNSDDVRARVRANEILSDHASRLAFELECCLFDNERFFNQACAALDAYKADVERLHPSPPTFLGEPIPAERAERYRKMRAARAAKIGDHSLCSAHKQPAPATGEHAAAVRTLERIGYTYHGGVLWKPPLGPAPTFDAPATGDEREAFMKLCEALGIPATAGAYLEVPRLLASAAHRREDQRGPWWTECGYQTLFNAIAAATDIPCEGMVGVSVIKFRNYLDGIAAMQRTAAPAHDENGGMREGGEG